MNNSNDLILRVAAIKAFDDERVDRNYGDVSPESVIKVIKSIPAVDVVPVMHGRWYDKGSLSCRCSCCGCKSNKEYNYCPNCGAKMDSQ